MNINKKALEFYSTQVVNDADKKSILEALASDFLSRGPKVEEFEKKLGNFCKNKNVVSVNSATSALQLAYQISGVESTSIVWTTPITFVATVNAALQFGARVDFVDIDPLTLNMCPHALEEKLRNIKRKSNLPNFVTVVHFAGSPCDLTKIFELSLQYGFKIIEDASHALGALYKNVTIGQNKFSEATVFSFHPVKMITTGEGGAIFLKSKVSYIKAKSLRSHGIDVGKAYGTSPKKNWYYEQSDIGYNFRMSELQAALGASQIERLESFVEKRNILAKCYKKCLSNLPLKTQDILPGCRSSYHLFTIEIADKRFSRDDLYMFLKKNKLGCQVHYIPVHLQPFFKKRGFTRKMFPNAENYFLNCLSIPLHPILEKPDIKFVADKLNDFFTN